MQQEIIDLKEVMERVSDDKELFLELLDIYKDDYGKKRAALGAAIAAKEIGKIKEIAHSMKGSSGNISAKSMYGACLQLEGLAKTNKTDGMEELLKEIDRHFEDIKAYADKIKKEWA